MRLVALCLSSAGLLVRADDRPVIGILAQPLIARDAPLGEFGDQYLVASYVKWIEMAGARVVPVQYNQSDAELTRVFGGLSGLVVPGACAAQPDA
jgi:gamma-glutamyl hydrolase